MSSSSAASHPGPALDELCRQHILVEKWLIAPSLRIGQQWLESAVRCAGRVANLHITTPSALALEVAAREMSARKLVLAGPAIGWLITQSLCRGLAQRSNSYFAQAAMQPTFYQSLYSSLTDLRMSGIEASQIRSEHLETPHKAADLAWLLDAYLSQLQAYGLIDAAGVLQLAIQGLSDASHRSRFQGRLLLIPDLLTPTVLEREFLSRLPADAVQQVVIRHATTAPPSSVQLLKWLPRVSEAPTAVADDSLQIFRAVGECNEVREVLRRCLQAACPLDQVEILYTDADTYAPLLYQLAQRLTSDTLPQGVPITFADGLPADLSRPGRALQSWLRWIDNGFPQALLVAMLGDGLLNLPADFEQQVNLTYAASVLRPIAIGHGAVNYLSKLDEQIAALSDSGAATRGDDAATDEHRERRRVTLTCLRHLIEQLLSLAAPISESASAGTVLSAVTTFLEQHARARSEFDRYASESLLEQINEMQQWLQQIPDVASSALTTWLSNLPHTTRVLGSGPRPGHLHASSIHSGGHSGRSWTMIVGLDDTRFPAASRADPIVLDGERARISSQLVTSGQRVQQQWLDAAERWSRLSGRVSLSWSCRNLQEDRELFPSPVLLAAFRLVSGEREGDHGRLNVVAGPPVSFAPQSAPAALDESEQWLWWLSQPLDGKAARKSVHNRFPCVARGDEAQVMRFDERLSQYYGWIPQAAIDYCATGSNQPVLSATKLELCGRCPLAFFFAHRLQLSPLEELDPDLDQWLDPAQLGTLAHEVFRRFMSELAQAGELPSFEKHHARLARILGDELDHWRSKVPPGNESAFRSQYWKMVRMTQAFLIAEEELCATSHPKFFEAALGLPAETSGTDVDSDEPVLVQIGEGLSLRMRGRLDRIDQLPKSGNSQFAVWDYKTGSGYGYEAGDPFNQGRVLQNVLYLLMAEAALQSKIDRKAQVASFGYFFPAARTAWKRIVWSRAALLEGRDILSRLVRLLARGVFPATTNDDDCKWCDFAGVCHDVKAVAAHSRKLLGEDHLELSEYKELRGEK